MAPMNQMKPADMVAYMGFGEADHVHLRALWPLVEPELDNICAVFYARALSNPVTSAVLGDPGRVSRLMSTLRVWMMELLNGPWDAGYWERRSRIGHRHVEINLPPGAMFSAMTVVREELSRIILRETANPTETLVALCKVTELDLGVITGTYYDEQRDKLLSQFETLIVSNIQAPAILLDSRDMVTASTPAMERLAEAKTLIGRPLADSLPPALIAASDLVYHLAHARRLRRSVTLPRVDVVMGGRCTWPSRWFHSTIRAPMCWCRWRTRPTRFWRRLVCASRRTSRSSVPWPRRWRMSSVTRWLASAAHCRCCRGGSSRVIGEPR